ncbi:MAG: methyltransferase domain-containing protein [Gammaproteobacteria bacterium]|nr:methyltransferase domain-containing protein [Gammaproteobacteria bacterium]MDH5652739.1 methyltransferase domain-containing protein [Gammaproteobacteria bacterium]
MDVEAIVKERYSEGAKARQEQLCCPVDYDTNLLKALPTEILEKDYGCGDPSRYVRKGDTVLDLGSGGGKICYMAAQLTGSEGRVIGVDINDDMLELARKYRQPMQDKLGGQPVEFVKGYIQDLALDVAAMEAWLAENPVNSAAGMKAFQEWQARQKSEAPLIADNSIDLVVSNCVLNLVSDSEKRQLISEIHRVLKPGGRVAVSDIVADEWVPEHLKKDPSLWSGCISGAFQEHEFLQTFIDAGFLAVAYDKWDNTPWQVVEGIEFRSVTLTAVKGQPEACLDRGHAVIYRGPYASITDDEGHLFYRGERMAVCERSFKLLTSGVFKDDFIGIIPATLGEPVPMCAPAGTRRPVSETKSAQQISTSSGGSCCC